MVYRAGIKYQAADALSRLLTDGADRTLLEDYIPLLAIETLYDTDTVLHFADVISDATVLRDATKIPLDTPQHVAYISATPTIERFVNEQAKDAYCRTVKSQVRQPCTEFQIDYHGLEV